LTERIKSILPDDHSGSVIGIFDASILISLELLLWPRDGAKPRLGQFGIVTTGKYWEQVLTDGAREIMERENIASHFFSRVVSTGLSAAELHTTPAEEVKSRMIEATKKLLEEESVRVICLGCAGMAGMDATVREACIERRGPIAGEEIHIVDGIQAAISVVKAESHKGENGSVADPSGVHLAALQTYLKSL
jgi:Asp/Glu/hydantoin racemase